MTSTASLTIRHAIAADEADLTRLAALDSSRVPSGELLVAELDGRLVAALSVDTGAAIADPFEHTAAIVDSMRAQVARDPRPAPGRPARPPRPRAVRAGVVVRAAPSAMRRRTSHAAVAQAVGPPAHVTMTPMRQPARRAQRRRLPVAHPVAVSA